MTRLSRTQSHRDDFSFQVGQLFRYGTTVFKLADEFGKFVRLEHIVSLESKSIEFNELAKLYAKGDLVPCTKEDAGRALAGDSFAEDDSPLEVTALPFLAGEKANARARQLITYLTKLRSRGFESLRPTSLLKLEVEKIRRELGDAVAPKASTLYSKSLAVRRNGGSLEAVIPRFKDRGGRGASRLETGVEKIILECIQRVANSPKTRVIYTEIARDVFFQLLQIYGRDKALILNPSLPTIAARAKQSIGEFEIYERNHGRRAAEKLYRTWSPRDRAIAPLEVVEFDDKDTRVFSIDAHSGLPCGRIFLTAGVDQYSAVPLGFSISDKPRNTWSALNAFGKAVLPKDTSTDEWSLVKSDVPYMGKIGIAVFDNALYNHATVLQQGAIAISNSVLAWARPYTPTEKSIVEDFNGRMIDFLVTLPGFGGPKYTRDLLVEGQLAANLTLQDFRKKFLSWTYDLYANKPRADGLTPKQKWVLGMRWTRPRLPCDVNAVMIASTLPHRVKLRAEHINFVGLIYQHPRIQVLRKRFGQDHEIDFRYHPEQLVKIFVFDVEARTWFVAQCANPEYAENLTLAQHILIRKTARENGAKNPAVPALLQYRAVLAKRVADARFSPKLKERKWSARLDGAGALAYSKANKVDVVVITDLQAQVEQLTLVEMDDGDEEWEFPSL